MMPSRERLMPTKSRNNKSDSRRSRTVNDIKAQTCTDRFQEKIEDDRGQHTDGRKPPRGTFSAQTNHETDDHGNAGGRNVEIGNTDMNAKSRLKKHENKVKQGAHNQRYKVSLHHHEKMPNGGVGAGERQHEPIKSTK
jgi:hypothetical protein